MSALRSGLAVVDVSHARIAPSTTARPHALELCPSARIARAGLQALDAFDALQVLASGAPVRIVAIASGAVRSHVLGHLDRSWMRRGLRAAVPRASDRTRRAAAEVALWLALGARAREVERVEIDARPGALVSALVRDRADLGWSEDDPAHAPRTIVPWASFGGRSGLPSPQGPVVVITDGRAPRRVVPALSVAVQATALADRAESWCEIATRRGWSVARAHAVVGGSLADVTSLSVDDAAVASVAAHAARLARLGLLEPAIDLAAAIDGRPLERAERLARSMLGALA